jgi:DNA-binding NarL/FixJ family response regulator
MAALRVIVADDHDIVRKAVTTLLRSLGVEVVGVASNGTDAIERVRDLHPDLVVMDGHMPQTNGYEATRAIKAHFPAVYVALVTISDGSAYQHHASTSRADAFIDKSALNAGLKRLIAALTGRTEAAQVGAAA